VNQRLAYVAVPRGRYDAQVYTDNKGKRRTCWTAMSRIVRRSRVTTRIRVCYRTPNCKGRISQPHDGRRSFIKARCSAGSRVSFGGCAALDTASAPRRIWVLATAGARNCRINWGRGQGFPTSARRASHAL
jgi:hypothetical protein